MEDENRSPDKDENQSIIDSEEKNDEATHSDLEENIQSRSTSTSHDENVSVDDKPQAKKDTNECPWRAAPRLVPSTDPSIYSSFSRKKEDTDAIAEGVGNISFDAGLGVPSLEKKEMVLIYPRDDSVEKLYEYQVKAGKWMLFGSGDYDKMDAYWNQLKPLCDAGIIAALKTSTPNDPRQGVIRAYLTDSDNKANVKDVAEKIFDVTGYDQILYYKTNEASLQGMYRQEGMSDISRYKHDKDTFYIKVGDQWQPWP